MKLGRWMGAALGIAGVSSLLAAMAPSPGGGGNDDEMTVSIRMPGDAAPTIVTFNELKPGESRTLTSDGGKPVVVTRTDEGYTLKVGDRDFQIDAPGDHARVFVEGGPGKGDDVRTIVTGDGMKKVLIARHGYAYQTGDEPAPVASVSELVEKQNLHALDGADRRTKEAVVKAIEELIEKGAVIAPGVEGGLPGLHEKSGDRVEIKVMKKRKS